MSARQDLIAALEDGGHLDAHAERLIDAAIAEAKRSALPASQRQMLGYALDLAQDQIYNRGDEFTPEDQAAIDELRRMADAADTEGGQQ